MEAIEEPAGEDAAVTPDAALEVVTAAVVADALPAATAGETLKAEAASDVLPADMDVEAEGGKGERETKDAKEAVGGASAEVVGTKTTAEKLDGV